MAAQSATENYQAARPSEPVTAKELPSIFSQSWGPLLKPLQGAHGEMEKALELIPPAEGGKLTRSGMVTRDQLGEATWATFLGADPQDKIELRSANIDEGKFMITATCQKGEKQWSVSATSTGEEMFASAREGQFVRSVSWSNRTKDTENQIVLHPGTPMGAIVQLDDLRTEYALPGSHTMVMNSEYRHDGLKPPRVINNMMSGGSESPDAMGVSDASLSDLLSKVANIT